METAELKAHPLKGGLPACVCSPTRPHIPEASDAKPSPGQGLRPHCHAGKLVSPSCRRRAVILGLAHPQPDRNQCSCTGSVIPQAQITPSFGPPGADRQIDRVQEQDNRSRP
jgi:hypothetical protein